MSFAGFPRETMTFLRSLSRNNNRDWFEAHRDDYEAHFVEPAKAFVIAMAGPLYRISPQINAEPRINGAIRRINRDVRFSKDKRPYKDHLDFLFSCGRGKGTCSSYFLRVGTKKITVGGGAYDFDKNALVKYRSAVAGKGGAALDACVKKLKKGSYEIGGEHYKRVPRGFDADHPRATLLRFASLYTYQELAPPPEFHTPKFVETCNRHFANVSPLVEWLGEHVAS